MDAFIPALSGAVASRSSAFHSRAGGRRRRARVAFARTVTMKQAVSYGAVAGTSSEEDPKDAKQLKRKGVVGLGKVCVIGLSHHTATVEVREKLAIAEADWQAAAMDLCGLPDVNEAAVLSTCNRFEVYFVAEDSFSGIRQVCEYLAKRSGVPLAQLRKYFFMLTDGDAVMHLLRVSAGLDSLVVGEGQILSQVRRCYELANDAEGGAGKILSKLLNSAVASGKRVRSETDIARGAVSISSAAVELAEMKSVSDLSRHLRETRICILGAGNMSRLLVQHLVAREAEAITIVNRSMERAQELARMFPDVELKLRTMDMMVDSMADADIVFASTASREPIVTKDVLDGVGGRKMFVDISVPLNVSANVDEIDSFSVYNVDDLKAVVAKNQARRRRLIVEAEQLLAEDKLTFTSWQHSLGTVPCITRLQARAEAVRKDEFERVLGKLQGLSKSEMQAVEKLSKSIVNKMLHGPMSHIKEVQDMEERKLVLKNLESMFQI